MAFIISIEGILQADGYFSIFNSDFPLGFCNKGEKQTMERKELAVELKHNGHNCAQAVLCAFEDELQMSKDDLKKMGSAFGVGMGCMEGTCGALIAAQMVMGLKKYEGAPVLRDAAGILKEFENKCGATICKDLKGRDTGVVICECDDCVRHAVEVVEGQM